jgi:hypothetical protein
MGIDDNTPTKHLNINVPIGDETPRLHNINFHGRDARILLTITPAGRMILGPDISKEKATQEVAQLLLKEFHRLTGHKETPESPEPV